MEYNLPSELIKQLDFGQDAKSKIIAGVQKLAQAVKSTLGASGKCVIRSFVLVHRGPASMPNIHA